MKKAIFVLSLALLTLRAFAGKGDTSAMTFRNTTIKKVGSTVSVSFDIEIKNFPQNNKVLITPVLYNNREQSTALPSTTIVGKKRNISDRRKGEGPDNRHTVGSNSTRVIPYSATVPFEMWMQEVSAAIVQVSDGCGCRTDYPTDTVAQGKLLYYVVSPSYSMKKLDYELTELEQYDLENPFLHAMEDYSKRYNVLSMDRDKNTSKVVFKVGSSVVDSEYAGNAKALAAIIKAFDVIRNDSNAVLKHIVIAGYASPEGTLALNTRLGQARAESVMRFIMKEVNEPIGHLFELHNGREDWGGLREMVLKSAMDNKAEIINIIDSYTIDQEIRKTKLKQLNGGAPYKYMLEHMYPALRTGGYIQVYYEISHRETFSIAVTDAQDRTVWVDPHSPRNRCVTAINKVIDEITNYRYDEALNVLMEFKEDPRAWNYIGVCYMMTGRYDEAGEYLYKAASKGDPNALENLEQIKRAREVEK